jgi:hypothetical protein
MHEEVYDVSLPKKINPDAAEYVGSKMCRKVVI